MSLEKFLAGRSQVPTPPAEPAIRLPETVPAAPSARPSWFDRDSPPAPPHPVDPPSEAEPALPSASPEPPPSPAPPEPSEPEFEPELEPVPASEPEPEPELEPELEPEPDREADPEAGLASLAAFLDNLTEPPPPEPLLILVEPAVPAPALDVEPLEPDEILILPDRINQGASVPLMDVNADGVVQIDMTPREIPLAVSAPSTAMIGAALPAGDDLDIPPRPIRPTIEVIRRLDPQPRAGSRLPRDWTPTPFDTPPAVMDVTAASATGPAGESGRRPNRPVLSQQALRDAAALASALLATPPVRDADRTGSLLVARDQRLLPAPAGMFLWRADYLRQDGDLIVRGDAADPLIVRHFFAADLPPDLATPDGLRLEASTAIALAQTFGERRSPPGTPTPAVVTLLTGPAMIKRPGEPRAQLVLGDRVGVGDLVETGGDTKVSLSFGQSLRIDLGSATRMRVDQWSQPSRASGPILELTMLTGAFASIAAMSGMPPLVSMRTPCGTVSWCDASVLGQMAVEGLPTMFALLRRAVGVPGVLTVINGWGTTTLGQAGHALPLRGHRAPGDPVPLTDTLIDSSAFCDLLPSRQREDTLRAI